MDGARVVELVYGGAGILLVLLVVLSRRARRHGGTLRAGVVGATYGWRAKDEQEALDIIIEGRAAETDPESPDGDLPSLESPGERDPRE